MPRGAIRVVFDDVSFCYAPQTEFSLSSVAVVSDDATVRRPILSEISFVAEPGELLALVGPSGAGKSTITHLITRIYDAQKGSITVNGVDVRDVTLQSLRERVGVVTQDPHLFHDTVRANLLYAKPSASDRELLEVLDATKLLSLIESLPQGLNTIAGERGYHFSGGEKQRLAIARLLLKQPDMVILDEATAHLDSQTEASIQAALDRLLVKRTSIVIAHRLSTVVKADQILVVDHGRIVQRGKHSELLKKPGSYAELCRKQFEIPEERAQSSGHFGAATIEDARF